MRITIKYLETEEACPEGIKLFRKIFGKSAELSDIIKYAIKTKNKTNLEYANWLINKKMNREQWLRYAIYAIYAVKLVLPIYENKYPNDKRLRYAIRAARKVLKNRNSTYAYADATYANAAANATSAAIATNDANSTMEKILRYGLKQVGE